MTKPEPFELTDADKFPYVDARTDEKETMVWIKDQALTMIDYIDTHIPKGREASLAKTKIEEAVMWSIKGLTA